MGPNPKNGVLEPLDLNHLLATMPEMGQLEVETDVIQFTPPIDSSDMNPQLWARLANLIQNNYETHDGFVILHGTDTMAYTASALSFMLQNLTKPVILTGSQLPMGVLRTDGKENVITSIELAAMRDHDGRPKVPEVCIYFGERLLRGNRATKIDAEGFIAFDTFNFPHLCDAGVNFHFHHSRILAPQWDKPLKVYSQMNPNIIVFSLFPGIQAPLVEHIINAPNLRGIVMRTYGSGNAPQHAWFKELLAQAIERGIIVVNISQCVSGSVAMERYDTGYHLLKMGVVSGGNSTVEAAVTKLMHLCALYPNDPSTIRKMMSLSLAGEITL